MIGPAGVDVQNELERVLNEKGGRKQADRARELTDHLDEWAEEGSVDPSSPSSSSSCSRRSPATARAATATARATTDSSPQAVDEQSEPFHRTGLAGVDDAEDHRADA